ncbi:MAG: hypothetical protein QOI48_1076 [Solirubrobacteraceae bacterium]|nr:hypothetical protein [Solirubrobacteraceae bacterium]
MATASAHPHDHHAMPTSGGALTRIAISATLHCLTGCAIGEIAGMLIGTALGFSNLATIVLSVLLAFVFGYGLTSLPLLRAGLALGAVIPIALASDTLSIATMEIVDNTIVLAVPGAMNAGLGQLLFWGSLAFSLAVAGAFAVPVNRWLIARGKGHAVVHQTGIHGGLPPRVVGVIAAIAFIFGASVLLATALDSSPAASDGAHSARVDDTFEAFDLAYGNYRSMGPFARVTVHSRRTSAPSLLRTAPPPGRQTYVDHRLV